MSSAGLPKRRHRPIRPRTTLLPIIRNIQSIRPPRLLTKAGIGAVAIHGWFLSGDCLRRRATHEPSSQAISALAGGYRLSRRGEKAGDCPQNGVEISMSKEPAFNAKGAPVGTLESRPVPAKLPHRKALSRWSAWTPQGELLGAEYNNRDSALCALIAASQIDPWLRGITTAN